MTDAEFLAWAKGRGLIARENRDRDARWIADNSITCPNLTAEEAQIILDFLRS